jgi:hypothetical protein
MEWIELFGRIMAEEPGWEERGRLDFEYCYRYIL